MRGVGAGGVGVGGVPCNVASAEEIFMYLLDRCGVCVCVKGLWLCLQWSGHLCVTPCDG